MSQIRLAVDGNTHIRRGGGANQKIDLARLRAGLFQQTTNGFGRHMRRAQPLALEDVTFLNAGPLGDPRIGGINHPRQIRVGKQIRWDIAVNGGNGCAGRNWQRRQSRVLSYMTASRPAER